MQVRFAFNEMSNGRFLVVGEVIADLWSDQLDHVFTIPFQNENQFLTNLVNADLSYEELLETASIVLLSINKPVFPQRWATVSLTAAQMRTLGIPEELFSGRKRLELVG